MSVFDQALTYVKDLRALLQVTRSTFTSETIYSRFFDEKQLECEEYARQLQAMQELKNSVEYIDQHELLFLEMNLKACCVEVLSRIHALATNLSYAFASGEQYIQMEELLAEAGMLLDDLNKKENIDNEKHSKAYCGEVFAGLGRVIEYCYGIDPSHDFFKKMGTVPRFGSAETVRDILLEDRQKQQKVGYQITRSRKTNSAAAKAKERHGVPVIDKDGKVTSKGSSRKHYRRPTTSGIAKPKL